MNEFVQTDEEFEACSWLYQKKCIQNWSLLRN